MLISFSYIIDAEDSCLFAIELLYNYILIGVVGSLNSYFHIWIWQGEACEKCCCREVRTENVKRRLIISEWAEVSEWIGHFDAMAAKVESSRVFQNLQKLLS